MWCGGRRAYGWVVLHGVFSWSKRRPLYVDLLVAAVPYGLALLAEGPRLVALVLSTLLCVPLLWRRRYSAEVLIWTYGIGLLQLIFKSPVRLYDFALIIAVYSVAAYGPRWAIRTGVWGGLTGGMLGALEWSHPPDQTARIVGILAVMSPVVVGWALGTNLRTRRAYLAELEERAARLEWERDTRARIAVAEERARIARELHDVVAHNVSVIVVQADGAGCALREGDLDETATAIDNIGATGRTALAEMRLLLGVLRGPEPDSEDQSYAPQPGLAGIEKLARQVPLPVQVCVNGAATEPPPPGIGLTAYRIVQEALTNTIKHAGPGALVTVRLDYEPGEMRILVEDDGVGPREAERPGHGLVGMRERVALFGGTIVTGARPGGGFRVSASLPWRSAA